MNVRILLVEDNPSLVNNLKGILHELGYSVRCADTCLEALKISKEWMDIALVDLMLPDGDGTALARELKQQNPHAEIILLTGFASIESAAQAVRAGAWAYLVKPCATQELLSAVETASRHVRAQEEKRQLAKRAQTAEKLAAVGTLTAGLSHEIRNPLNGAALQLAVLERRIQKLPKGKRAALHEPLLLVKDEIRRLERILDGFMQFARPNNLEKQPLRLDKVVGRVIALLQPEAQKRNIALEFSCVAISVLGDEDQLYQVFMNLTLNALDATPQGGTVRLLTMPSEENLAIVSIDDSGASVPPNEEDRIFEPFFTTKAQGSGLGLPISHAIVTQHGGHIQVRASSLGGACFFVSLPKLQLDNSKLQLENSKLQLEHSKPL
ncbi:MAG: response regulator [Cystobacterineae bacterium]|nr:response regulator [Cystobacterineae bacterium]